MSLEAVLSSPFPRLRKRELWQSGFALLALMPLLLAFTRAGADIALCGVGALFLIESARSRGWRWLREPEIKALGGLWGFMLLASFFTPIDTQAAFKAALIWGRFVLFYAAARFWLLRTPQTLKLLTLTGLPVLAFVACDATWQYVHGISLSGRPMISDRLTGPLATANLGNYLLKTGLPVLGMAAYLAAAGRRARRLWACLAGLMVITALVMVSGERSTALLLLLALGVIGMLLLLWQKEARAWVTGGAAAMLLGMGAVAATQPIVKEKAVYFAEQIADFGSTYYGQMYLAAWRLWQENPITGIGAQQFFKACQPERLNVTYCDVHPHNMYVEWLAAAGLPGVGLFALSMALILRRLCREARYNGHDAILAACAFGVFAVLLFPFVVTQSAFSNWPAMLFWYNLSVGVSLPRLAAKAHD